ncbi:hypothetical protein [Photobacterium ganghwense]|uniref:hypothetical protein n=1 Tax=Photobacterium ganghwense TaxID=320778 RepID=UPI0020C207E6|nr:hypothetical protein [Photobacterium ganghwense]
MRLKYILIPVDLAFSAVVERELAMALRLLDDDGKIDMLYVEDARAHHSMVPTVTAWCRPCPATRLAGMPKLTARRCN